MPYSQTWKNRGFKKQQVYTYYDFTSYERKMIERRLKCHFATGDKVEFI